MKKIILPISLIFLALGSVIWSSGTTMVNQIIGIIFILTGGYIFQDYDRSKK